jgi:hypothetical protein
MEYTSYIAMLGYLFLLLGSVLAAIGIGGTGNEIVATMLGWTVAIPIGIFGLECAIKGSCTSYALIVAYITVAIGVFSLLAGLYIIAIGPEWPRMSKSHWWMSRAQYPHHANPRYHRHPEDGTHHRYHEEIEVRRYPDA